MKQLGALALIFIFSSCGYQWGNRSERLPGNYQDIAVPIFKNKTQEVGAEIYFTNAMIEEISRNPNTTITSQEYADVVLEGEILTLSVVSEGLASFNDPNNSVQCPSPTSANCLPSGAELSNTYRVDVALNLRIRRKADQQVIWSKAFSGQRSFASAKLASLPRNSSNAIYNQSALHLNLDLIAEQLMSQAYFSLTESF